MPSIILDLATASFQLPTGVYHNIRLQALHHLSQLLQHPNYLAQQTFQDDVPAKAASGPELELSQAPHL